MSKLLENYFILTGIAGIRNHVIDSDGFKNVLVDGEVACVCFGVPVEELLRVKKVDST